MITEDGIYKLKLMGAIGFCERLNNSLHLQSIVDTGKTAQAALDSLELMDHI